MTAIALQEELSSSAAATPDITPDDLVESRRTRANRKNAQKSTGPRTKAGKARSSQNATTHGLRAQSIPPDLQDDPTFRLHHDELYESLAPATPAQSHLLREIAHVLWNLHKLPDLQRLALALPPDEHDPFADTPPTEFEDPTLRPTLRHVLHAEPTPLTTLWRYQDRLQARYQSLLRQYRLEQRLHAAALEAERQRERDRPAMADYHRQEERARRHARLADAFREQWKLQRETARQAALLRGDPEPPYDDDAFGRALWDYLEQHDPSIVRPDWSRRPAPTHDGAPAPNEPTAPGAAAAAPPPGPVSAASACPASSAIEPPAAPAEPTAPPEAPAPNEATAYVAPLQPGDPQIRNETALVPESTTPPLPTPPCDPLTHAPPPVSSLLTPSGMCHTLSPSHENRSPT